VPLSRKRLASSVVAGGQRGTDSHKRNAGDKHENIDPHTVGQIVPTAHET